MKENKDLNEQMKETLLFVFILNLHIIPALIATVMFVIRILYTFLIKFPMFISADWMSDLENKIAEFACDEDN